MKKLVVLLILVSSVLSMSGQTIELTFSAIDNESYIRLDSIRVINRTHAGDTMLYWPDTVLLINYVGIRALQPEMNTFSVFQRYPDPLSDHTMLSIYVPRQDKVSMILTDSRGRIILQDEKILNRGKHTFILRPGSESLCFFTARWQGQNSSIKILRAGTNPGTDVALEYTGSEESSTPLKETHEIHNFPFIPGDELIYACYYNGMESGIHDTPFESQSYTFQFATKIPCPGLPTVDYGGQIYHTIQVCSQCWLKENLNIGTIITAPNPQTDNDIIEKYCMGNITYYCNKWGGLYFWNEMMNYTVQSGGQGICPEGWHVPDELDWQILEGVADSEYGVGDPLWMSVEFRGYDAGGNLKETGYENWEPPNTGATDSYMFTALPGGYFVQNEFWGAGYKGILWTSGPPTKYVRNMDWNQSRIRKASGGSGLAASVRCIKD